jgi:hypothetical protein
MGRLIQLNILQLLFVHPKAVTELVDDRAPDLLANFCLLEHTASIFFWYSTT